MRNGHGVKQDYREAVKWYRRAAEEGYVGAQYALGAEYEHGRGVEKDISTAIKWYEKAAEKFYKPAQERLAMLKKEEQQN